MIFDLINRCLGLRAFRIDDVVQAVIWVVVVERLLGVAHRTLNGIQLLSDIQE